MFIGRIAALRTIRTRVALVSLPHPLANIDVAIGKVRWVMKAGIVSLRDLKPPDRSRDRSLTRG
jgi:hypothetical protein